MCLLREVLRKMQKIIYITFLTKIHLIARNLIVRNYHTNINCYKRTDLYSSKKVKVMRNKICRGTSQLKETKEP